MPAKEPPGTRASGESPRAPRRGEGERHRGEPAATPGNSGTDRTPGLSPNSPPESGSDDYATLCDEDLMRYCQEGDEYAFAELFRRYEGPALSFICRMIGDRTRSEALGQEAFLRIFKDAKRYEYPRSFSTWFYTIVRNLCKNELRWRSRHPTVSIEENLSHSGGHDPEALHIGDNLHSSTTPPLDQLVGDELTRMLEAALANLPALEREILILNRFQGLKYREIAEVVGLPIGTVRSRMHVALERLRRSIKEYL